MFNCEEYQAYLDDETGTTPFPCEHCAFWVEKTDACLREEENTAKTAYNVTKAVYPIKTTAKAGVDIPKLVKAQFPNYYNYFNKNFDWNNLDGILDFLYFHAKILHVAEAQQLIDLIESNCEVRRG